MTAPEQRRVASVMPEGAILINGSPGRPAGRGVERIEERSPAPVDILHDRTPDDPLFREYAWVVLVEPLPGEGDESADGLKDDAWSVDVSEDRPHWATLRAGSERGQLYALYHIAKCLEMRRPPQTWTTRRRPLVPQRYAWASAGNVWSPVCRPDQFDRAIRDLPDMGFNGVLLTCNATHGTSVGRQTLPVEITGDGVVVDRFKLPAFRRMFDWFKSFGLAISVFHPAYLPPGFTKEEVREHYNGDRDLPGLEEAIRQSSRELAATMFEQLPELDSLLFHSIECDWMWGNSVSIFPCSDDNAGERAFAAYLEGLTAACTDAGKDLLFWTHVSGVSTRQQILMHRVLPLYPSVVIIEDAAWQNNMWPYAPVMGHLSTELQQVATSGRFGLAVNSTDGEYFGAGALPTAYPDPLIESGRAAVELGAEIAFVRINEQALTPLGTLEDCNAINVIAVGEQWWEPTRPTGDLWQEWCERRFGAAAAPAVASALKKSGTIITRGLSTNRMPLIDHSGLSVYSWMPGKDVRAWGVFAHPGRQLVDKPYAELTGEETRPWQVNAHGVELGSFLEGHEEAVQAVREGIQEIESVRSELAPEDYAYLSRCFGDALPMLDSVRHAAFGARAAAVYLQSPNDANRRALDEACDAMELCADRIEVEHGIAFRHVHHFMKATYRREVIAGYGVPIGLRVIADAYRELID
jgi:hypothetical protein